MLANFTKLDRFAALAERGSDVACAAAACEEMAKDLRVSARSKRWRTDDKLRLHG